MGYCHNSTVVNATAEEYWNAVRNVHDFSWASNVISKVEVIGDEPGTEPGASRKLNDAFVETLIEINDQERTFAYSIDDGPGPLGAERVERYVGRVQVHPVTSTGTAFVVAGAGIPGLMSYAEEAGPELGPVVIEFVNQTALDVRPNFYASGTAADAAGLFVAANLDTGFIDRPFPELRPGESLSATRECERDGATDALGRSGDDAVHSVHAVESNGPPARAAPDSAPHRRLHLRASG